MLLPLLATTALAGTGPWTLPEGDWSLYGGADWRHFQKVAISNGNTATLDTGIRALTLEVVGSFGLLDAVEAELTLPWVYAQVDHVSESPCETLPNDPCATVSAIGLLQAKVKVRALDELDGLPVTLAAGTLFRSGEFTHEQRSRLTAPTEGQTDLGAFLTVGRSGGAFANGFYSGWAQAGYFYRMPNGIVEDKKIPGNEWTSDAEFFIAPISAFAIGPNLFITKRTGITLEDMNEKYIDDPDRYAMLAVFSIKYGAKILLRSDRRWTVVLGGTGTAYAENTAADVYSFSVGINYQGIAKDPS